MKAHPAHPETSDRVARAIWKAIEGCGLPKAIFTHIHGAGFETGKMLVTHPRVKAVGFTGSFQGGKALFDWANQRSEPIPVFSEMGSVNPVFLLPDYLKKNAREAASLYAGSITLGVGQFCTNPGLIFGLEGRDLDLFCQELSLEIEKIAPAPMLHPGIAKNYFEKRTAAMAQPGVSQIAMAAIAPKPNEGAPTIATVAGKTFLQNPLLHQEVFGPYSLVVRCSNIAEIELLVQQLEGQLTATIMASEWDLEENGELVESVKQICGRLIFNSVPTGVEVCQAMHHGGPFPATTDSRFTSVGADGIKRFARPISFQNWPDSHLPQELRNANPLSIWRIVNNELTKGAI